MCPVRKEIEKVLIKCCSCQKGEISSARRMAESGQSTHRDCEHQARVRIIIYSLDIETARLCRPQGLLTTLLATGSWLETVQIHGGLAASMAAVAVGWGVPLLHSLPETTAFNRENEEENASLGVPAHETVTEALCFLSQLVYFSQE